MSCSDHKKSILISIDVASYCEVKPAVDYMVCIIVTEAVLLVLVLSKLAYDVWHYHNTGELPWLARHTCMGVSYDGIKDQGRVSSRDGGGSSEEVVEDDSSCFKNFCKKSEVAAQDPDRMGKKKSNGLQFSLQDLVAFRPRRETASSKASRVTKPFLTVESDQKEASMAKAESVDRKMSSLSTSQYSYNTISVAEDEEDSTRKLSSNSGCPDRPRRGGASPMVEAKYKISVTSDEDDDSSSASVDSQQRLMQIKRRSDRRQNEVFEPMPILDFPLETIVKVMNSENEELSLNDVTMV